MIELCHVWGAVGTAFGVCFASAVLTFSYILEDAWKERKRNNGKQMRNH